MDNTAWQELLNAFFKLHELQSAPRNAINFACKDGRTPSYMKKKLTANFKYARPSLVISLPSLCSAFPRHTCNYLHLTVVDFYHLEKIMYKTLSEVEIALLRSAMKTVEVNAENFGVTELLATVGDAIRTGVSPVWLTNMIRRSDDLAFSLSYEVTQVYLEWQDLKIAA